MNEAIVRLPFDLPYEAHCVSFRTDGKSEDDDSVTRHDFTVDTIDVQNQRLNWSLDFSTRTDDRGVIDGIRGKLMTNYDPSEEGPDTGLDFTNDNTFEMFVTDQLSQRDDVLATHIKDQETSIQKEKRHAKVSLTIGALLAVATVKFGIDGHIMTGSAKEPDISGYDMLTMVSFIASFTAFMGGIMSRGSIKDSRGSILEAEAEKQRLSIIAGQISTNGIIVE